MFFFLKLLFFPPRVYMVWFSICFWMYCSICFWFQEFPMIFYWFLCFFSFQGFFSWFSKVSMFFLCVFPQGLQCFAPCLFFLRIFDGTFSLGFKWYLFSLFPKDFFTVLMLHVFMVFLQSFLGCAKVKHDACSSVFRCSPKTCYSWGLSKRASLENLHGLFA